jgi:hypothetical protein
MNTNQNQIASAGWQGIIQSDAVPENEVFQVRHLQPSSTSSGYFEPETLHLPIHFSPGYSDYLALLLTDASRNKSVRSAVKLLQILQILQVVAAFIDCCASYFRIRD